MSKIIPLFQEIPYQDPLNYFHAFSFSQNVVFFDSAKFHPTLGRYSFIGIDPFSTLIYPNDKMFRHRNNNLTIFDTLSHELNRFSLETLPELPPFQGGVAGFFSYDLARDLEKLPVFAVDDQHHPRLALGFYDLVVSFDHVQKKAWILSSGFPKQNEKKRRERSHIRLQWCLKQLKNTVQCVYPTKAIVQTDKLTSNFSQLEYIKTVQKIIEYILSGDVFEVNLSQRFQCILPTTYSPFQLYLRLRHINPATFSAYAHFSDTIIASSSPERFVKLDHWRVETRPIKGTSKRALNPDEDAQLANALLASEKDRAENTMIVDLMRNDLSKVCLPNTVHVAQYCGLESYETVHHLVSSVEGLLDRQYNAVDLLCATFPGGSITGAPKIRAMELIDTLEPTRRGPYCGSMGYIGFDGCMDTSVLIRTYVIKNNVVTFQSGGAIVLRSDPEAEYEETLIKAAALKRALTDAIKTNHKIYA
ncbi:MAG: hypothetical protein A3F41_03330 [Coxiella sp. RIFCSPHIGHO2_12_FULL_44_14]|nr:MAG: hypothetical protein A3F41_03330 [Coxiella sp. RIFCSPHIGHO2_12_FULL_44_14]